MPTRLFTSFMMPHEDSLTEDRVKYWVDVNEDYETVFNQVHPVTPPASSLEARALWQYTKVDDGKLFTCTHQHIMGFEEI